MDLEKFFGQKVISLYKTENFSYKITGTLRESKEESDIYEDVILQMGCAQESLESISSGITKSKRLKIACSGLISIKNYSSN